MSKEYNDRWTKPLREAYQEDFPDRDKYSIDSIFALRSPFDRRVAR